MRNKFTIEKLRKIYLLTINDYKTLAREVMYMILAVSQALPRSYGSENGNPKILKVI